MNEPTFQIFGRLSKDPEVKYQNDSLLVVNLSIPQKRLKKGSEITDWYNITVFNKQAETCLKYLKKGSGCIVQGTMEIESFEKNGVSCKSVNFIARSVTFTDRQEKTGGNYQSQYQAPQQFGAEPAGPDEFIDDEYRHINF